MTINSLTEHYEYLQAYSFFNSTLNTTHVSTSSIPDEFFSTHFPNKIDNRSVFIKNCNKLNDYITRSVSKKCHDNNTCLEIINFWLNGEVRSNFDEKNNSLFNTYKEFMQKYKNLDSYKSKIYYINNELYKKKKELYELYNAYDKLLSTLGFFDDSKCINIAVLVNNYNNIIEQYPENDNSSFSVVLTNFKGILQNQADDYIKKCGHRIPQFKEFVDPPVSRVVASDHSLRGTGNVDELYNVPSKNLASTFTITLFGTTVGVFLTLMFFYKITLFGYRLRNKKNNKSTMPNNLGEEIYKLPINTYEEHESNSQNTTYNLTYQSVENR
ncbi:PIR Superfamily Protein [Plasmodium ovale curtisi]|uniref:PIR Superfamily Protein n=1 Tax=Plasmodium ovale curtisi TaxID=864141 RepID=A0A1A8VPJ3_PLAOA|nr:PIR Superfamily Protein [Plasmodium ovale curtisi]